MSDFTTSFWSLYVAGLTLVSVLACGLLLWITARKKVAASKMSFDHKVEHLVLAIAGRQPTPRERRAAAELLKAAGDRESVALDDLWWSLQNSSDSIFDR